MLILVPDPDTPAGPYTQGDDPLGITATVVDDDGQTVPLNAIDSAVGAVIPPEGTSLPLIGVEIDLPTDSLRWDWPPNVFDVAGMHQVRITLNAQGGDTYTTEPLAVIVEAVTGWLSMSLARQMWPDAERIPDLSLWHILESARIACETYAPAREIGEGVPPNYREAQLGQSRAIWNLMQTAPQSDLIGYDQTAVRVYPLDYNVRQLLRPKSGKPVMW